MMQTQTRQPQRGLTFDDVWAMFQETDRKFQATDKKFQETEKLVKELSKNVGGVNRSIGDLIETLVAARLWEKFAGFHYNLRRAYRRVPIYDEKDKLKTDIDILLSNTKWCMAVEVKREADRGDVERHLERMELIRKYPPAEVEDKKMLGAIAGGLVDPDARDFARECGFFVLELKGEAVVLLDTPKGFAAREW
jgi:predicted AAA+ superfamily ATPase